ncbi:unnamed protein product, partial [Natator depressus]
DPPGSPSCSLDSVANGTALRFRCSWPGGSPAPSLSLQGLPGGGEQGVGPALERTLSSLLPTLSGTRVTCLGRHLAAEGTCSMTPGLPGPRGTVLLDLQCQGTYRPVEITWARLGEPLGPGGRYRVSADGARLTISNFTAPQDLGGYSVRCQNPLGSQESNLTLTGPSISGWSLARGSEPGSARLSWVVAGGLRGHWVLDPGPGAPRGPGGWGVADAADTRGRHSLQHRGGTPAPNPLFLPAAAPAGRRGWGAQHHADAPISASTLGPGAIAGIVLGSILGMILLLALLVLLIWFLRARWGKQEKMPLTPPGTHQHYLPRQFPNGRESDPVEPPAPPSGASLRCSWGDGNLSFISYEDHLRIHGPPASGHARVSWRRQGPRAPISGQWAGPQDSAQRHAGVTGPGDPAWEPGVRESLIGAECQQ